MSEKTDRSNVQTKQKPESKPPLNRKAVEQLVMSIGSSGKEMLEIKLDTETGELIFESLTLDQAKNGSAGKRFTKVSAVNLISAIAQTVNQAIAELRESMSKTQLTEEKK